MHTKKTNERKDCVTGYKITKNNLKEKKKYINVFALKVKKNLLLMLAIYVYLKKKEKKIRSKCNKYFNI